MRKIKVLRVVSKTPRFRRAGFQFSAEPTDIPLTSIEDEQRAAIEGDPNLVAYETEVDGGLDEGDSAKQAPVKKK